MKTLRIFHSADWHLMEQNQEQVLPAIRFFVDEVRKHTPDAVVLAGDLFVKRGFITPTESYEIRRAVMDIAAITEVVLIPGNHDATNKWDRRNSIDGVFRRSDKEDSYHQRIHVASKYETIDLVLNGQSVRFYCLPHPSKYFYMSQATDVAPAELNAAMTKALHDVMLGIQAEIQQSTDRVNILVGHGTISGGVAGNEMVMTSENDLAIDRSWLPQDASAIMYGHLHKPQQVGNAFYSGPLAPLTFGEEKVEPKYVSWEIVEGKGTPTYIPVPVAHQLLTIEVNEDLFKKMGENESPNAIILGEVAKYDIADAIVRVRARIPEDLKSMVLRADIEDVLAKAGAHEYRVVVESVDAIRVRVDEVGGELTHPALIELWASLDDTRKEYAKAMVEADAEIEALIPKESMHLLQGIEYELISIKAQNFKPLIDVEINIEELGDIVSIVGPNYAGKSQVAEIERFVFWKQQRKGTNLGDIVRNGETTASAELVFKAKQKTFKVQRTVKLDGKGIGKGDLILEVKTPEGWKAYNAGENRSTQQEIEVLVGTYEMYRATRFGSQREIDLLCDMLPAELTDTLQQAVGITAFDLKRDAAKSKLETLEKDNEAGLNEVERLRGQLSQREYHREQLKNLEAEKAQKSLEIKSYEDQMKVSSDELAELKSNTKLAEQIKTQITSLKTEVAALEERQNHFKSLQNRVSEINEGIATLNSLKSEYEATVTLRDEILKLNAELTERTSHAQESQADINSDVQKITDRTNTLNNQIELHLTNYKSSVSNRQSQIDALRRTGSLVTDVPCSGTDMNDTCMLLGEARKAQSDADQLEKELASMTEPALADERDELASLTAKRASLREEALKYEKTIREAREKYDKAMDGRVMPDWTGLKQKLAAEEARGWEQMKAEVLVEEAKMDDLNARHAKLVRDIDSYQKKIDELKPDAARVNLLESQIREYESHVASKKAGIESTIRAIGTVEGSLERLDEIEKEADRLEVSMADAIFKIKTMRMYIAAMARNGIPYLLLERALPRFEEYANGFLCVDEGYASTPRVNITASKETQSGKSREEVVITFFDDRGEHKLGEASGFQRVAIGYALRASMAKINADATGTRIKHCIFDEGWGAFDDENMQLGRQMIYRLSKWAGRFFYITHVPVLQQSAESSIIVTPVDGGAQVVVER